MRKSPDVAVVTNVAPNHLDVHKDMDEYVEAKRNILMHQNAFSRTVLNCDNEITDSFKHFVRGQSLGFSMERQIKNGAWLDTDGMLHMAYRGIDAPVMHKSEITILGDHNVANYLSAISAVWGYVTVSNIRKVTKEFTGVEHRIEFVRELDGVKYYNDSIASSPNRTITGLKSFEKKVILIAGGKDKNIPYDEIGDVVMEKVKKLVLTGATAPKIKEAVLNSKLYHSDFEIIECDDFKDAVLSAKNVAEKGDIVILSPASTSFDKFKNFEERGRVFKDIVNSL
jgi:UDP-N-acetylmuramoylalanine--D-glutamate ligase